MKGVEGSVRKATKDDDICLSSYSEPTLFVQNPYSAVQFLDIKQRVFTEVYFNELI